MHRIGFVVNPIAGLGGRVGLKGTDGKAERARELGGEPRAPGRGRDALDALSEYAGADATDAGADSADVGADSTDACTDSTGACDDSTGACGDSTDAALELLTYEGQMGEQVVRAAGFEPIVVGRPDDPDVTSATDTRAAVRAFATENVDLVLFVGGDGTAADVATTLESLDSGVPILGVPAGVKMYSAVFAVTARAAGHLAAKFVVATNGPTTGTRTERAEINDVDEDRYRDGAIQTELRAIATVPVAEERQSSKQLGGGTVETLAKGFADDVRAGVTYVLGPGSTVGAVESALGFDGTPLGVDVWRDGDVLVRDGAESDLLSTLGDENVIVVSPIGGQGFVFGRGNQQLSPAVIRQCDVEVVASRRKLDGIGTLSVDTGDPELDEELSGWRRVRVGAFEQRLIELT